eukprot:g436.t1
MYVKPGVIPHITHVSEDGYTLVHSHPPHLRGTKFFQWGKDMSGQFMQDFMSASDYENEKCTAPYYDPWCEEYKHEGDYTELQVGPAPTQMHTFPVPGNSVYEWSEWFKGYQAETSRVHGGNYTDAVESVNEWMRSSAGLNQEKFKEIDDFLKSVGKMAPEKDNIMAKGMPWGGLREKLTGISSHIPADWELANYARKLGSKTRVQTVDCDLQSFQSVRSCASKVEHICKAHGGLDALLNNAGIMGQPDSRTIDGHDIQMQTNHLSHFLLTNLLMPSLEAAAAIRGESRVVQHSSGARASFTANTKSGEPSGMLEKKFFSQCDAGSLGGDGLGKCFTRYHQTKLANSVFALTLHERLKRSGSKVKSICAEPGVAATELSSNLSKGHEEHGSKPVRISSPEETFPGVQSAADGACSIVEAAFGTHVLGGDFFMPGDYVKKTVVGLPTKCMTAGVPTPKNELIKNGFRMEELTMSQKNRDLLWHCSEQATNISWKFLNRSKL